MSGPTVSSLIPCQFFFFKEQVNKQLKKIFITCIKQLSTNGFTWKLFPFYKSKMFPQMNKRLHLHKVTGVTYIRIIPTDCSWKTHSYSENEKLLGESEQMDWKQLLSSATLGNVVWSALNGLWNASMSFHNSVQRHLLRSICPS